MGNYEYIKKAIREMGYCNNMFDHYCEQGNECHYANECIDKLLADVVEHFDTDTLANVERILAHIATLPKYQNCLETPFEMLAGGGSRGMYGDSMGNDVLTYDVLTSYEVYTYDMLAVDIVLAWSFDH
jgi:hypothetical protein